MPLGGGMMPCPCPTPNVPRCETRRRLRLGKSPTIAWIGGGEVVVLARPDLDVSPILQQEGAIAVEFHLVRPLLALGQDGNVDGGHRLDEGRRTGDGHSSDPAALPFRKATRRQHRLLPRLRAARATCRSLYAGTAAGRPRPSRTGPQHLFPARLPFTRSPPVCPPRSAAGPASGTASRSAAPASTWPPTAAR
jgi:hypothetical protein